MPDKTTMIEKKSAKKGIISEAVVMPREPKIIIASSFVMIISGLVITLINGTKAPIEAISANAAINDSKIIKKICLLRFLERKLYNFLRLFFFLLTQNLHTI